MSSDGSIADPDRDGTAIHDDDATADVAADSTELSERERLAGELASLEAENRRLREEYARSQQTEYRRTAAALVLVGALAAGGGLLFPSARTVLFALAGTGAFLGALTYYLAPEQFLPASVGRDVYGALAHNHEQLGAELGLSDRTVYVPTADQVRLYVPQSSGTPLPDEELLGETFVVGDGQRGVAFRPTGVPLFAEFERAFGGTLGETPDELGRQLTDALVEQFELVESVDVESAGNGASGQLTVGVVDSAYGPLDQFGHPVPSFLAVGLASGVDVPVSVTVDADGTDRVDAVVTCRWPADAAGEQSDGGGSDPADDQ